VSLEKLDIIGLREFNAELRRLDTTLPKAVRELNFTIASDVATKATSVAESLGGVARKVAPSLKALAQQARAQVKLGGPQYPMAMGAEFGSVQFHQFKAWRGSGAGAGYFLYPTVQAKKVELVPRYRSMLDQVTKPAFPQ